MQYIGNFVKRRNREKFGIVSCQYIKEIKALLE